MKSRMFLILIAGFLSLQAEEAHAGWGDRMGEILRAVRAYVLGHPGKTTREAYEALTQFEKSMGGDFAKVARKLGGGKICCNIPAAKSKNKKLGQLITQKQDFFNGVVQYKDPLTQERWGITNELQPDGTRKWVKRYMLSADGGVVPKILDPNDPNRFLTEDEVKSLQNYITKELMGLCDRKDYLMDDDRATLFMQKLLDEIDKEADLRARKWIGSQQIPLTDDALNQAKLKIYEDMLLSWIEQTNQCPAIELKPKL